MPRIKLTGDKLFAAQLNRKSLPGLVKDLNIPDDRVEEIRESLPTRDSEREYIVMDASETPPYWVTMPHSMFKHYYEWSDGPNGRELAKVVAK
ncbi:hypothetical protein MUDCAT_34 [Arthrobacter phage Mudcat]|uniref:Uncharacterized protein n=3 Tax=Mudcatvirus TaxID=1982088 RepID=A0A222Z6Z6_9CAUD|nr:hypothetical protein BI184_gp34 [Arthrobacter phage Mudcat]YP_010666514.1 hypothetical protein PQB79_gp035 [Arthrobacter phage Heisenberger]YP_010666614.1 hypothetical protein PQB80_gp035 [Arthrobacter phage JEGGS]AMM44402.1 hypothetical protein MUDCAT_34 [Arthrobacter phage Mudcat]ASR80289.1 hypothetical protein SEA_HEISENBERGER_35 [Arthrobacter phage Heisenberger]QDM57518.1 hypothetical protein SEA_JEGGS_35 [Arthrobacter phage JEGGS]